MSHNANMKAWVEQRQQLAATRRAEAGRALDSVRAPARSPEEQQDLLGRLERLEAKRTRRGAGEVR